MMALALALLVALGQAAGLSDAGVQSAIRLGETNKFDSITSSCTATAGFGESMAAGMAGGVARNGSYLVIVSGAEGRIAFRASQGKRLYKPLTIDAVTEEMRAPGIFVTVEPNRPSSSGKTVSVAAVIEQIVLKSKARPDVVIQPENLETEPVEWTNLVGGKVEGNRAVARFPLDAVREMPAGDFDVVIVAAEGERRCKVGAKDRAKITPSR